LVENFEAWYDDHFDVSGQGKKLPSKEDKVSTVFWFESQLFRLAGHLAPSQMTTKKRNVRASTWTWMPCSTFGLARESTRYTMQGKWSEEATLCRDKHHKNNNSFIQQYHTTQSVTDKFITTYYYT